MIRDLNRLADGRFDVLVVGGGILGAGVARDAALRGLKVALVDQGDFANGTSSRSSKLAHGGLRYLKHGHLRLVRESCLERETLLRIAPHLVKPIPILFPCYRGIGSPLWQIRAGLAIYDFLAGVRVPASRRHRMLSPPQIHKLEPELELKNMDGAGQYFDCQMNDARLCLENILSADQHGAAAANYVRVTEIRKAGGRICGASLLDLESGAELRIETRVLVNATGPWADVLRSLDDSKARPRVRKTKGIHLVTRRLTHGNGLALTTHTDGRLFFILPFDHDHSLIGTTDTDSREDPLQPVIERKDVDYLLAAANFHLPEARLTAADVQGAFAGLRTLIDSPGDPSRVSREYTIEEGESGMISIVGGKYTTYRAMAERVVDRICRSLDPARARCLTRQPLPGAAASAVITGCGIIRAEILHAIRTEMARRPMDFLRRRTTIALTHPPHQQVLRDMADIFQQELGWTDDRKEKIIDESYREWLSHHLF